MHAISFAEYTTAGGVAGAAFTGLGASVLHLARPDSFDRSGAALAGFIGGSVTHAVYGVLAAFDGEPGMSRRLQHLGRSMPLAALTSGLVGGVFIGLGGDIPRPDAGGMVLSGVVGGALIGLAATTAVLSAKAMCARPPRWTMLASGDLETGERLMGAEATERHPQPSAVQRIAATFHRVP